MTPAKGFSGFRPRAALGEPARFPGTRMDAVASLGHVPYPQENAPQELRRFLEVFVLAGPFLVKARYATEV